MGEPMPQRGCCPYCRAQVDPQATKCPHCGEWIKARWARKDISGTVLVVLVVVILLLLLSTRC